MKSASGIVAQKRKKVNNKFSVSVDLIKQKEK